VPGVVKVWAKVWSVSRAGDVKSRFVATIVCGTSSRFAQVTDCPTATVSSAGAKVKLSIETLAGAAACVAGAAVAVGRVGAGVTGGQLLTAE